MNLQRLSEYMRASGLSNREIAAACHVSATTLYNILNGADAKISTVEALASVLGVPVGSLFDDAPKAEPARQKKPVKKNTVRLTLEMREEELHRLLDRVKRE